MSNFLPRFLNNCLRFKQPLPQRCLLCTAASSPDVLCAACHRALPRLPQAQCTLCAAPTASGAVCGTCLRRAPRFDRVAAALAYSFPVDALIHAFKYGGNLALAQLFGEILAQRVDEPADAVIPMPLSRERLRSRGFNQAHEIARVVGQRLGIPVLARACRKVADTQPQALLPWSERARNVRGAFVCDLDLRDVRVAVVDDVMTTGATMNEIARNLRQAGAVRIVAWVVARAL